MKKTMNKYNDFGIFTYDLDSGYKNGYGRYSEVVFPGLNLKWDNEACAESVYINLQSYIRWYILLGSPERMLKVLIEKY